MNEAAKMSVQSKIADAMWSELRTTAPPTGLERIRGLLDVFGGRREASLAAGQAMKHQLFLPDLPTSPWLDPGAFGELPNVLAAAQPELKAEVAADVGTPVFRPYGEMGDRPIVDGGTPAGWEELRLWEDFHPTAAVLRYPAAARAVRAITEANSLVNTIAVITMKHGTRLPPHVDPANWNVSLHLGIVVPAGAAIRVGGETRTWREDACIAFDNSFEHEAWNEGAVTRVIFAVHLGHPNLTAAERVALRRLSDRYRSLAILGPAAAAAWAFAASGP
jgi:hypothetical protein